MRKIIGIVAIAIMTSCTRVKVKQECDLYRVCSNTYNCETRIWTYTHIGLINTIEYSNWATVKESQIDSTLNAQRVLAFPTYVKVLNCLQ